MVFEDEGEKANYRARMSEQQKEAMRMKDKERKKAKREAAKMAKNIKPVTIYKTKPALSKATTKAFRALPSGLARAHEVDDKVHSCLDSE